MKKTRRTKIVVETERLLVVRTRRTETARWCATCAAAVEMIGLDEAATLSARGQREIVRRIEAGTLHLTESTRGRLLVCLNSLLADRRAHANDKHK